MKPVWHAALLALGVSTGSLAPAQTCPSTSTHVNSVGPTLSGNTVCAARGSDKWQEFHAGSGSLVDYKKGPTDPVDPTTTVGTWTFSNGSNGTVTYSYTGGSAYTYAVCKDNVGSTYTFVSLTAGTITGATLKAGQGPC